MSSIGAGGAAAPTSSEPRKKFGKNLNKLTKPPPPPAASAASCRGQGSSRNGLLVLSTKRSSLVGSASSNLLSKLSGGAAPRPLNTPSLRSEVGTVTTDGSGLQVKLGDGNGGWGTPDGVGVLQQQAWKVEEKQVLSPQQAMPVLAPKGGVSAGYVRANSSGSGTRWGDLDDADDMHPSLPSANSKHVPQNFSPQLGRAAPPPPVERNAFLGERCTRYEAQPLSPSRVAGPPPGLSLVDREHRVEQPRGQGNFVSNGVYPARTGFCDPYAAPAYGNGGTEFDAVAAAAAVQNGPVRRVDSTRVVDRIPQHHGVKTFPYPGCKASGQQTQIEEVSKVDEQVQYMSRLARERAEARRVEEERRMIEQKERAARRLKELEEKMHSSSTTPPPQAAPVPVPSNITAGNCDLPMPANSANWRQPQRPVSVPGNGTGGGQGSEIVLERLGRTKNGNNPAVNTPMSNQLVPPVVRASSDTNRTYSSLVGGSTTMISTTQREGQSSEPEMMSAKQHSDFPKQVIATPPAAMHQAHNQFNHQARHPVEEHPPPPITVIQLSSYDDRDRGERGRCLSGPRMLFDPKSGSMVEAPSFDKRAAYHHGDENGINNGKARKERRMKKAVSDREKDRSEKASGKKDAVISLITKKRSDSDMSPSGDNTRSSRRAEDTADGIESRVSARRQEKKDEVNGARQRREKKRPDRKKRSESVDISEMSMNGTGDKLRSADKAISLARRSDGRVLRKSCDPLRLPRTRGVLYKRDEHGNYVCADGCEADQGYGLHSVPGGRARNPAAYAKFLEQHKAEDSNMVKGGIKIDKRSPVKNGDKLVYNLNQDTPLSRKGQKRIEPQQQRLDRRQRDNDYGKTDSPVRFNQRRSGANDKSTASSPDQLVFEDGYYLPVVPSVTAQDALTLLTDGPESPTLQATASPWRPSEAALAAAAAVAVSANKSIGSSEPIIESNDDRGVDDEETESTISEFGGLGFDPTQNMDSVMMSPSLRSEAGDDEDIPSLSLDAGSDPVKNPFTSSGSPGRYLGSSTWGTGGSLNSSPGAPLSIGLSWNLLGTESGEKNGSGQQKSSTSQQQPTASFLSLSPLAKPDGSNTWGTGAFGGGIGSIGTLGRGLFNSDGTGGNGD